ncbi:hypothetical protein J6590_097795 [Homalodisca vitripennis]|nr:hypothetical protein J6590_097795 [Homalodisca vitripennis]
MFILYNTTWSIQWVRPHSATAHSATTNVWRYELWRCEHSGQMCGAIAAHTLDVQCTPCKHDVPKLDETCQCVEVSVLSTPCIAWYDGNQDRFDFRPAVPPFTSNFPSC